jgi:acyl carrier protein
MSSSNQNQAISDPVIYEKLTTIFRTILEDNGIVLRPETSEADIPGWDSFANASLIAAMEKDFGIRFRTAELQSLHCVGNFADLIRAKLQGRG